MVMVQDGRMMMVMYGGCKGHVSCQAEQQLVSNKNISLTGRCAGSRTQGHADKKIRQLMTSTHHKVSIVKF